MKKHFLLLFLLGTAIFAHADFFVEVTRGGKQTYYAAEETGVVDFQGRTQFLTECLALQAGDVLKCYDAENKVSWAITTNDVGDTWGAPGFTASATGLSCSVAGNYDVYIKMKYEDDCWYIEGPKSGCTAAKPVDPNQGGGDIPTPDPGKYNGSAPAQYPGVMLQAFYWDSYQDKGHGRTKWIDLKSQAAEIGQWFDLVWLPPSAKSTGGTGYLPVQYSSQDSDWGTKKNLKAVIDTLHQNGCRVVADMVANHAASSSGWCTMAVENFGSYGTFNPTMAWICNSDEATGHCTETFGGADDGYGSEANYEAGRDWCHSKQEVRDMFKAYAQWLRNEIGYDGFRYDYCKGFHMSHVNEYNTAGKAFFSVLEYWDGDVNVLQSRLNDANWNTCTFDFATKYTALNNGIAAGNYNGCRGAGLLGAGKGRYAVTFVDSHDSYQRDANEFLGPGNSMKNLDGKTMQANAYILCMPGTPCVFYPHWVTWKADIKAIINARYKAGVHNESAVNDESGNGYYKATVTGTNGQIRLLLGPNSDYNTTPAGFTLAAKGTNWGVYYKTNSARGDKDQNRTPITPATAIEEVIEPAAPATVGTKIMENGHIYILVDGARYNMMGQRVE